MRKLFFLFFVSLMLISFVCAEVQYPVSNLGNCASEGACEVYCDNFNHIEVCLDFAEENNLMTEDEIEEAKKFMPLMISGETPGNCKSQKECDAYCENEANIIECVDFAVKVGIMDAEEAEMVKKTGGKGPGNCKGESECDKYCEDEANIIECVDFAVKYGMMDAAEAERVKKSGGKGPGNCKGKEECDEFCNKKENFETCIDFSVQYGFMSAEEAEMVKKSGGESPGGCKNKEECDVFCNSEEGRPVCLEFSYEHGMISEEDYRKIKEGGFEGQGEWSGPGGCKTEEECKAYCETGEHMQECMDDALKNGYISQEEYNEQIEKMEQAEQMEQEERKEGEGGESHPGEAPGGEPGDYYVPPVEAPEGGGGEPSGPGGEPSSTPGDAPGGDSAGSYEPPSSDSGGGGEGAVTGGVITEKVNNEGFIQKIIDSIQNLFK